MKIITLAWGEPYVSQLPRLARSAEKLGIPIETRVREGTPLSRQAAWLAKAEFFLEELRAASGIIVMVDCDAVLHRYPSLMSDLGTWDFLAFRDHLKHWQVGVLAAQPTPRSLLTVETWVHLMRTVSGWEWDMDLFERAVKEVRPDIRPLPPDYAWGEKWNFRDRYGNMRPVIEVNA